MVETRIEQLIEEAVLGWIKGTRNLRNSMVKSGTWGGSNAVFATLELFEDQLAKTTSTALEELGRGISGRRYRWNSAHSHLDELLERRFSEVPQMVRAQALGNAELERIMGKEIDTRVALAVSNARASVLRHQAGWDAPNPKPLHERFRIALAIVGFVAAYFLGMFSTEIKDEIAPIIGIHQSNPTGKSSVPPP